MDAATYPNKDVIEASHDAVFVMSHSGREHGEEEVQVRNGRQVETRMACRKYPTMRCQDHLSMNQAVSKHTAGIRGIPCHVMLRPNLEELGRHPGALGAGEFVRVIEDARKALGAFVPWKYWQGIQAQFAKAEALVAEGSPGKAWKELDKAHDVAKKFTGLEVGADVERRMTELVEAGRAKVEEAAALDAEAARARLEQLRDEYRGSPVEKDVKEALASLK